MVTLSYEERAIAYFELYTGRTYNTTDVIHRVIVSDMSKFLENTNDNLGLNSITLNGISESNMSMFPDYIVKALGGIKKRVKFL